MRPLLLLRFAEHATDQAAVEVYGTIRQFLRYVEQKRGRIA
jgi:hypothetical protein